jgi:hypothetical protein
MQNHRLGGEPAGTDRMEETMKTLAIAIPSLTLDNPSIREVL